jgi:hypothetical protein
LKPLREDFSAQVLRREDASGLVQLPVTG